MKIGSILKKAVFLQRKLNNEVHHRTAHMVKILPVEIRFWRLVDFLMQGILSASSFTCGYEDEQCGLIFSSNLGDFTDQEHATVFPTDSVMPHSSSNSDLEVG